MTTRLGFDGQITNKEQVQLENILITRQACPQSSKMISIFITHNLIFRLAFGSSSTKRINSREYIVSIKLNIRFSRLFLKPSKHHNQ